MTVPQPHEHVAVPPQLLVAIQQPHEHSAATPQTLVPASQPHERTAVPPQTCLCPYRSRTSASTSRAVASSDATTLRQMQQSASGENGTHRSCHAGSDGPR
eukprot:212262-Chlamydomonas_euryale.AAC.2